MTNNFIEQVRELNEKRTQDEWKWSGRSEEDDGDGVFIWHPQGSYLGGTLITLGDTYEDDHYDLDFIALAPQMAEELLLLEQKLLIAVEALRFIASNQFYDHDYQMKAQQALDKINGGK
jgi:hypothetical protein